MLCGHSRHRLDPCGDGCFATTGKLGQEIQYINVSLDVSELDYEESEAERTHTPVKHGRGSFGTYAEIKAYVLETFGMKVSSLYIGQIKDKVGIKERKNSTLETGCWRISSTVRS